MATPPIDFIDELKWRGLFHQCTDEAALRAHLKGGGGRRAYAGFDPTSDSLTIGNLVPIMALVHFQRAGHEPIVVMGGGTGLIGDPSGKSAERLLMTEDKVRTHVEKQRPIFERVFENAAAAEGRPSKPPAIVNNLDWLGKLGYLDVLRDVGKHFSVNMMIQKDSIRERLHARDQGISYTEFSYMILQSYDFLRLYEEHAVLLQMGGSDQWGNVVAGIDLIQKTGSQIFSEMRACLGHIERIEKGEESGGQADIDHWSRRREELERRFNRAGGYETEAKAAKLTGPRPAVWAAFGLTAPLVTKSDGGKFGKTEAGAIWLSAQTKDMSVGTSAYAFSQFWLNASDADACKYLRLFTLLSKQEVEALEADHAKEPGERKAQRRLAREVTSLVHGKAEADAAEAAAKALFSGEIASLPEAALRDVLAEAPSSEHDKSQLGAGVALADLLPLTTLAKSKREAKELLQSGSLSVNGRKAGTDDRVTTKDLLHGTMIALRRGKKTWHVTRWK